MSPNFISLTKSKYHIVHIDSSYRPFWMFQLIKKAFLQKLSST